jgi:regulation of enolase protein 1 (concanavalin A-like superfamily)
MMTLPVAAAGSVTMRVTRHGEAIRVQVKQGEDWQMVRLAFADAGDD